MTQPAAKAKGTLPAKPIIRLGRFVWTTMWHVMMSRLAPRDASGSYIRPASEFRNTIASLGNSETPHTNLDQKSSPIYPPAAGRYRLYVGMGCPWAHRTLVVRALKGLEDAISVTIVSPSPEAGGWVFDQPENGFQTLAELYQKAKPGYTGRSTVPVLWDTQTQTIVNNESAEIIVMLNDRLNEFAQHPELDLYPPDLRETIDSWNEKIYHAVNNGVYRCGFAQTQAAYDSAVNELFTVLDEIDAALEHQRYLCGSRITLADVRLFTTLIRFDAVYFGLFKCDRRRVQDYPNLSGYLRDLYQLPGVAETCDLQAIKRDYYGNLFPLNPGGIIPAGFSLESLRASHDRAKLAALPELQQF